MFNYTKGKLPPMNGKKPFFVFISCSTADCYNQDVFAWGRKYDNVYYVVADDDIKKKKMRFRFFYDHILEKETKARTLFVEPDQTYRFHDLKIKTLDTCDGNHGCAFLVKTKTKTIYHAGHLNDWSWPHGSDEANAAASRDYHKQIGKLADTHIDCAFVLLNPKQEEHYARGIDEFMRRCNVDEVYPIHFKDDRKIISFLLQDEISEPYRDKIRQTADHTY